MATGGETDWMSLGEWVASLAGHDDNHLDQLGQVLGHIPGRRTP